mgnify:CR=1 FL=1
MKRRFIMGVMASLLVLSTSWWANKALVTPTHPEPLSLSSAIHTVRVSGKVRVRIYETQHPQISGERLNLKRSVQGNEIKLSSKDPITFDLGLSHLDLLQGTGNAQVSAYVHNGAQLVIDLADCASVTLTGKPNIAKLSLRGQSQLKALSLASSDVDVHVKNLARVRVAGAAENLTVKLLNQAFFDATGLSVNHAWVSTSGQSVAHLGKIHTMRAYANERGEVFSYQRPAHLSQKSEGQANILNIN